MYHAYSKKSLGHEGLGWSFSLNPQVAIDAEAEHLANVLLKTLEPKIPGLVKEVVKSAVPAAVEQLKPRIPELVGMAVPEIKKQIPVMVEAAMPAIKKQIPAIIKAAEAPLEDYVVNRLYPKVIKPLAEKELSKVGGKAKFELSKAALGGGSLLVVGVVAFLAFRKSQRKAQ